MQLPLLPVLLFAPGLALAQSATVTSFAAPVRLMVGEKYLGQNRSYPSPVGHDLDGDGRIDLVIGDLPGKLTVATRLASAAMGFAVDKPVMAADGAAIKFDNW